MFGEKLKELRINKNLKQEQLGEVVNVTKGTISSWEMNRTQPPIEIIVKLARYFGVTTDYLLGLNINNAETIDKINEKLREANIIDNDETFKEEELKVALEQARKYKEMWKRVNDLPNKYPEGSIKREQIKDT